MQYPKADQIGKMDVIFSSKEDYLARVYFGFPGVVTVDHTYDLKKYGSTTVFYNEIQKDYIKDCDATIGRTVFQNFAQKIVDHKKDYNCTNVCIPIWLEPITNTIEHDLGIRHVIFVNKSLENKVSCYSILITCSWHQKSNSPIHEFKVLENVFY